MGSQEPKRETLTTLRAARQAHRVATDVGVSDVRHLSAVRCRACGQRFSIDPAAARTDARVDRERVLCPGCRDREAATKAIRIPPKTPLDETFSAHCAQCRYLLRGLTRADRCPECGLNIAVSLDPCPPPTPGLLPYFILPNKADPADPVARNPSMFNSVLRRMKLWLEDVDGRRGAGKF